MAIKQWKNNIQEDWYTNKRYKKFEKKVRGTWIKDEEGENQHLTLHFYVGLKFKFRVKKLHQSQNQE